MWLAAGCPLRQERRTNYFSLSFIRKSDLSSSGKCNYQATVSFLFWQVALYSTQAWGKVLMVQHRNLHAFLNMNIHLISNLNDGTQKKLLFPPTHAHLSEASINCQYILYKNNSRETHSGKTLSHSTFVVKTNSCKSLLSLALPLYLCLPKSESTDMLI